MELTIQETRNMLREVGLRSTMTRIAVLRQLWQETRPVSHSEIVTAIQEVGDQATVYRSLLTFVDKGLARVASNAGGIARYEPVRTGEEAHQVHPHFVCSVCHVVSCLPQSTVITTVEPVWRERLHQAELQFVGVCIECE